MLLHDWKLSSLAVIYIAEKWQLEKIVNVLLEFNWLLSDDDTFEPICIFNDGTYSRKDWATSNYFGILEFSDIEDFQMTNSKFIPVCIVDSDFVEPIIDSLQQYIGRQFLFGNAILTATKIIELEDTQILVFVEENTDWFFFNEVKWIKNIYK